jgi:arginine/lysine/ornithine decarboxylase
MIMAVCAEGDKIIQPRNVHRSVINALVLSGAVPVYVNPGVHASLGISTAMARHDISAAIARNKDAKAVLLNNPTYYGICPDLSGIIALAKKFNMKVLADEAHGAHFYFGEKMPVNAMAAGADFACVSMHKSGGSLTQSSILLAGPEVNRNYVRKVINLTQTTSASYLLMVSLDIARKKLAMEGKEIFKLIGDMTHYARQEINQIGCYYAFAGEITDGDGIFDFDPTKLSVNARGSGLAGIEIYDILRDEYDIQIEFGDTENFLAYISVGDSYKDIERLVSSLSEIYRIHKKETPTAIVNNYINPIMALPPREAFYAPRKVTPISAAAGEICSEFVMCYPPGIPIVAPGEIITREITDYIELARARGCLLTGAEDLTMESLMVVDGARKSSQLKV